VQDVNVDQKQVLLKKIRSHFKDQLQGKKFAVWGLSFKPKTDDIREASSCDLIEGLLKLGASVCAYDPEAMPNFKKQYAHEKNLSFAESPEEVINDAEALVLVTEWTEFRSPSFELLKEKLKSPIIFDGRNVFDAALIKELGFTYYSIGRQGVLA
jgi:UDPglucose 6-dehydrogenase